MTNEEQKLREFADKWGIREDDEPTFDPHTENPYYGYSRRTKQCLSDLTDLISENYYPKEFVEWMMMGGHVGIYDRRGYLYSSALLNLKGFTGENTIDNLFNYWKENEQ